MMRVTKTPTVMICTRKFVFNLFLGFGEGGDNVSQHGERLVYALCLDMGNINSIQCIDEWETIDASALKYF